MKHCVEVILNIGPGQLMAYTRMIAEITKLLINSSDRVLLSVITNIFCSTQPKQQIVFVLQ